MPINDTATISGKTLQQENIIKILVFLAEAFQNYLHEIP